MQLLPGSNESNGTALRFPFNLYGLISRSLANNFTSDSSCPVFTPTNRRSSQWVAEFPRRYQVCINMFVTNLKFARNQRPVSGVGPWGPFYSDRPNCSCGWSFGCFSKLMFLSQFNFWIFPMFFCLSVTLFVSDFLLRFFFRSNKPPFRG